MNSYLPEISVIVPIYNREDRLKQCVDSILAQKFKDFELILIDDGSTDRSSEICDFYAEKHDNCSVIHQANAGVSAARNHGLDVARGKYIAFCDCDDTVTPEWLECMYQGYVRNGVKLSICCFAKRHADGTIISSSNYSNQDICLSDFCYLWHNIDMKGIWNKLFLSNVIKFHKIHFIDQYRYGEDTHFVLDYLICLDPHDNCYISSSVAYFYLWDEDDISLAKTYDSMVVKSSFHCLQKYVATAKHFGCSDELIMNSRETASTIENSIKLLMTQKVSPFKKLSDLHMLIRSDEYIIFLRTINISYFGPATPRFSNPATHCSFTLTFPFLA